jgi:hypothetical protein
MNSVRIANIAQRVRHTRDEPDLCATFHVADAPAKWVQYGDGKINAAYPIVKNPTALVASLGGKVVDWEAGKYLTVTLDADDARSIARWIDTYLRWVLQSPPEDAMTQKLSHFKGVVETA